MLATQVVQDDAIVSEMSQASRPARAPAAQDGDVASDDFAAAAAEGGSWKFSKPA
jgi:hypothetical protein